jgi:tetratricopeptide (TPR) repeat protein
MGCSSDTSSPPQSLPGLPSLSLDRIAPSARRLIGSALTAVEKNPRDPQLNGRLGMALHAYEQFEAAEICYGRAHDLDPQEFRWAYYLGAVQFQQRKYAEAAGSLRVALDRAPEDDPARLLLARALLETGDCEESRRAFQVLLEKHDRLAEAHYGIGRCEAAVGRTPAAVESYRRALALDAGFQQARYALAMALRDLGATSEAQQQLSLYREEGAPFNALPDPLLDEVRALKQGDALDHLRRAVALEAAGKLKEAADEQNRALSIDPTLVQAHVNLISVYGKLGAADLAGQHYREGLRLNPQQAELHYNYGVLLSAQGRFPEASAAFQKALAINPYSAEAHTNLGQALERQGQLEQALQQYHLAIENKPNFRLAYFHLGRVMLERDRVREAIPFLEKALGGADEQEPVFMALLSTAYARAGETRRAVSLALQAKEMALSSGRRDLAEAIEREMRAFSHSGGMP